MALGPAVQELGLRVSCTQQPLTHGPCLWQEGSGFMLPPRPPGGYVPRACFFLKLILSQSGQYV